jgi:hypothetical protein
MYIVVMNTITCPKCKKEIEITEAISHKMKEEILAKSDKTHKEELEKQKRIAEEKAELTVKIEIDKARKQAQREMSEKSKSTQIELLEAQKKQKLLEEKLQSSEKDLKIREEKIREEATKEAQEKSRLDKLAFEKKIADMQKTLEEAQRKGNQGSQQLQGEVLELDLEEKLKNAFPGDEFLPIPKGVEGGDIWQKINLRGKNMGSILWETKRTKAWSNGWIAKLKSDSSKINASEAILISEVLPQGVKNFDRQDGVWITTYEHALSVCRFVRFLISKVSSMKPSIGQTPEEWEKMRDYILSDSFKHKMQSHFDGIKSLKDALDAEKRATILRWKKQESIVNKLDANITNFYGDLKEIVTQLPQISGVDSPLLEDVNAT